MEHLQLIKRYWTAVALITLLACAGGIIATNQLASHQATLFFNIGAENDAEAADQFSETVQGWFKNPDLLNRINTTPSARKQEKQNIVVTFGAESEQEARKKAETTIQELKKEITAYNAATKNQFQLAIATIEIKDQNTKKNILVILAFLLGLALSIGLAYLYEYMFGLVSYRHQAETVLKKKSDDIMTPKGSINLLEALINHAPHQTTVLMGISHSAEELSNRFPPEVNGYTFPQDAEKITRLGSENLVVICKLGKTKLEDLEKLQPILPQEYLLVTSH